MERPWTLTPHAKGSEPDRRFAILAHRPNDGCVKIVKNPDCAVAFRKAVLTTPAASAGEDAAAFWAEEESSCAAVTREVAAEPDTR